MFVTFNIAHFKRNYMRIYGKCTFQRPTEETQMLSVSVFEMGLGIN